MVLVLFAGLAPAVACKDAPTPPVDAAEPAEEAPTPNPYADTPSRFGTVPLHAGFSPDPRVVSGEAVGEVDARSLHRRCRGWISEVPDYLVESDTAFFRLYVLARSREDVSLVVRKPNGSVLCNDNRYGARDPMVRGNFPIGSMQVWVGVKEKGGTARYRLGFSEVKWKPSVLALPDAG
jgi:hypothetical protein